MKTQIRKDEILQAIAKVTGMGEDALCSHILETLYRLNVIIADVPDDWGIAISTHINYSDSYIHEVSAALFFGKHVDFLDAQLGKLVLIGDGDCPVCGGETELFDREEIGHYDDGHITPKTPIFVYEERKCINCKWKFTVN